MIFEPIEPSSVVDAIVDQIESLVLGGVLHPGEKLPSERDLAAQLDVSRPTLRVALEGLEEKGLLESRPGGGTYVTSLLSSSFTKPLMELLKSHPETTLDYLEFRYEIESMAAYYAAQRATPEDKVLIRRAFDAMEAVHGNEDNAEEARLDADFHLTIIESAHNVILLHVMRGLFDLLRGDVFYNREQLYVRKDVRDLLLDQHRAMAEAVIAGDPEGAKQAARQHLTYVRQALLEIRLSESRMETSRRRLDRLSDVGKKRRRKQLGDQ